MAENEERAEQFIAAFHDLPGKTVAEARRGLFQLLNSHSDLVTENLNVTEAIVSNLVPKTHLEHIFCVDVLIFFRSFPQLYQKFLEGDEITVSKVAKQRWFFEEIFKRNGNLDDLVNQLFPSLSYSTKLKLLKKFNWFLSEEEADELYDRLTEKYGAFMASNIILSCSVAKIKAIFKNVNVRFSPRQLMALFDKDPTLLHEYLKEHTKKLDNSVYTHIARKDMDAFLELRKASDFSYSFGKRTTKKLVITKRDAILANPEYFVQSLHKYVNMWRLVRKLGKDFKKVYASIFPKDLSEIDESHQCIRALKYYAKNGRASLFTSTFEEVFGTSLKPQQINSNWLQWVPDSSKRDAIAKFKLDNGGEEEFLKFCNAQYSFDTIMSRLNYATSSKQRTDFWIALFESCVLSKDYEAFVKVLDIQTFRLKNDKVSIYTLLMRLKWGNDSLKWGSFLAGCDERHWMYLAHFCHLIKDVHKYDASALFMKYLEFLIKQKKPVKDEVRKFVEENDMDSMAVSWQSHPVAMKACIEALVELGPKNSNESIEEFYIKVISALSSYDSASKDKNQIHILGNPKLVNAVVKYLKGEVKMEWASYKKERALHKVMEMTVNRNWKFEGSEEFRRIFWEHLDILATPGVILWFLRHEPEVFEANCGNFFEKCFSNRLVDYKTIYRRIKAARQTRIQQKIVDFCRLRLTSEDDNSKDHLSEALANLSPSAEYLSLVLTYKPAAGKVDAGDERAKKLWRIQNSSVKNVRITKTSPAEVLPVVLQFCTGYYLEAALVPLTKALYRIPEHQAKPYLDQLGNIGELSVKKHSLFLSCVILDQASAIAALKASKLQPQSLTSALKYFAKNPSEAAWEVTKSKLLKVNKNDKFANKLIIDTVAAPPYRARYFENAWRALNDTQNDQWKKVLLTKIKKSTYPELPETFVTYMISADLMKAPKTEEFVSNYLIHSTSETKYQPVFEALKKYKEQDWKDPQKRKLLFKFITVFYDVYLQAKAIDIDLVTKFLTGLQKIFRPVEAFEEFIIIAFMKCKGQTKQDLAKSVIELNHNLVTQYGQMALRMYSTCLRRLLTKFCKNDVEKFEFFAALLEHTESIDDVLLIIKLLPEDGASDARCSQMFHDIIAELREFEDDQVKLHLNVYIKICKASSGFGSSSEKGTVTGKKRKRMSKLLPSKRR